MNLSSSRIEGKISLLILILICFFLVFQRISNKKWKPNENVGSTQLSFDSFGYYIYLPSFFIYDDFSQLNYLKDILPKYKPTTDFSQAVEGPTGKYVNKYTMGQAVMFPPFFLLAHYVIVPVTGFEPDGFSVPYQMSIAFGCLLYSIIALFILRKILLKLFNDNVASLVLLFVAIGTNFLYYSTSDNTLPHNQLFFVFTLILFYTTSYYEKPGYIKAVIVGLLVGLAGLIRPTELIISLVPVFWGISDLKDLSLRLKQHSKGIMIMAISSIMIISLQLIYWKVQSGRFVFYGYGNEQLNLWKPHLAELLFSFRKGWFIYTPMMALAIAGFIPLFKEHRRFFIPLFIYIILNIWIVSAWDCWWYGGCFGQRSMVQSYALLSIPLSALFFSVMQNRNALIKYSILTFAGIVVFLNLFQIWQYKKGFIHYENMTLESYMAVFGKTKLPENYNALLKEPDYSHYGVQKGVEYKDQILVNEKFDGNENGTVGDISFEGGKSYKTDPATQFGPTYSFKIGELPVNPEVKTRCRFKLYTKNNISSSHIVMTIEQEGQPAYIYKSLNLGFMHYPLNSWNDVEIWMNIPKYASKSDFFKVYIWNTGDQNLFIDNFEVILQKKVYLN